MSKAEAFEVNFGENKSIGVNVNFSKGDAIQVPVSINSLDAEKVGKEVGDRIAEKLDETALASVAKESTLLMESQRIQDEIRNIDLSSVEDKIDNIDLSSVAKQGENAEATNSKILEEVKNKLTPLEAVLTELNHGKQKMVDALVTKNVQSSADKTLAAIADDVRSIAQSPVTIDGGEMYEKQLFGAPTDKTSAYAQPDSPMWNLYQVMANLLSDGKFVTYGGILLAELAKDSDTQVLAEAGAGGAYLTSDGKMYAEDVIHTWDDALDGKMNRWIAYCFVSEWHDFTLGSINPTSIHIGRNIGTITCTASGRLSKIVVTEGNELSNFYPKEYSQHWDDHIKLRLKGKTTEAKNNYIIYESPSTYIHLICENIAGNAIRQFNTKTVKSVKIDANSITTTNGNECVCLMYQAGIVEITANSITGAYKLLNTPPKHLIIKAESLDAKVCQNAASTGNIYFRYISNDKTKYFRITDNPFKTGGNIHLQAGWNKPLNISPVNTLDEDTIYKNILQQLKQDEEMCGRGVTITLGATNLAKLTSEEAVALLDSLTNIYGYTFA